MAPTSPVRFDSAAAEEAARQLLATAESIAEVLVVLDADNGTVTEDWQGHFRNTFDHEMTGITGTGQRLADILQQMAAVVRSRAWQAEAAQAAYERAQAEAAAGDGG